MSPRIIYNDSDVELLARIMKAEALGEGEEGMLMVGNVVVNRVVANCDVFKNTRTISEVIYQKNAFSGVGQPLFNQPVNAKEKELALRNIDGYRIELCGKTSQFLNFCFDQLTGFMQMHMPRNKLGKGIDNRDNRFAKLFFFHSIRTP